MAYKSLSTANLPNPAIDPAQGSIPQDYFNTVLWTGDGTSGRSITTGHQPDFVWTKERNSAINHIAQNSISGTGVYLHPNTTAAEQSATTLITSFDSDGFTIGNSGSINGSSDTYVAWSWKANGSGVSNTDGSITSTVSANTESGFSIVTFSGASAGTVGHGLGAVPKMILMKTRTTVLGWYVYTQAVGSSGWLQLNTTAAAVTGNTAAFGGTDPTSSVFSYGSGLAGTGDYVAYCFADVEGFSKVGSSYTGNGSADGPFVYTGFRPAFVMYKRTTSAGFPLDWPIIDSVRNPNNGSNDQLRANLSDAENTLPFTATEFLSNGFKIRTTDGGWNASGENYIYMAFAEQPFKFSNAR